MDPSVIGERVIGTVIGAGVVALLSLAAAPVRQTLFYRRSDYDFEYVEGSGNSTWDLQWPWLRLTVEVEKVSNDKIDKVSFRKDKGRDTEKVFEPMHVGDTFHPLFDGELYVQLKSIMRQQSSQSPKVYMFQMAFRRRRRIVI